MCKNYNIIICPNCSKHIELKNVVLHQDSIIEPTYLFCPNCNVKIFLQTCITFI